ncbi:IclR family transcriptional regulator C-terminal domain-containing protein [Mesorhizobium sp. M0809]|uniref:IclR family transcriptional regulator C-terminal domain-containing protein n=1 Tax=Mesorhizobium sp. M0809 TaxID=2957003 RepID=UPI00333A0D11
MGGGQRRARPHGGGSRRDPYLDFASAGRSEGLKYQPELVAKVRLATTATGKAYLSTLAPTDAIRIALSDGGDDQESRRSSVSIEAFLEELKLSRDRGWALSKEEAEPGVVAIAAPIQLPGEKIDGTVSVAGPSSRLTKDRHKAIAASVISTAAKLGKLWPLRERYNSNRAC